MYQPPFVPQPFPIPTSEQAGITPMGYMMSVNVPPPNMPSFQQQQMPQAVQPASKKRERNILKIMDPATQQVINETEIAAAKPAQEASGMWRICRE